MNSSIFAKLSPAQARFPIENGIIASFVFNAPFVSKKRSGSNFSGSGKYCRNQKLSSHVFSLDFYLKSLIIFCRLVHKSSVKIEHLSSIICLIHSFCNILFALELTIMGIYRERIRENFLQSNLSTIFSWSAYFRISKVLGVLHQCSQVQ